MFQKREFQDAIDIYSALLRSCHELSGWLVEQLTASTLHNICVLHLWKQEYDLALLFSRECIRYKADNVGDNVLMMVSVMFVTVHNLPSCFHMVITSFIHVKIEAFLGKYGLNPLRSGRSHICCYSFSQRSRHFGRY